MWKIFCFLASILFYMWNFSIAWDLSAYLIFSIITWLILLVVSLWLNIHDICIGTSRKKHSSPLLCMGLLSVVPLTPISCSLEIDGPPPDIVPEGHCGQELCAGPASFAPSRRHWILSHHRNRQRESSSGYFQREGERSYSYNFVRVHCYNCSILPLMLISYCAWFIN